MVLNKYKFISDLLDRKKLKPYQKEKILQLAVREIGEEKVLETDILERLEKIEQTIFSKNNILSKDESEDLSGGTSSGDIELVKETLPNYFPPQFIHNFLVNYNQNPILKSTCHDLDGDSIKLICEYCQTVEYNFEAHRQKVIEAFNNHEKRYKAPHGIKNLIRAFLTGKTFNGQKIKGWSTDEIKIHWSLPNLMDWSNRNPGIPPNLNEEILAKQELIGYEIDQINSIVTGNIIQNFTQLTIHFKNLFHIRHDNSLYEILANKNQEEGWNQEITFIFKQNDFPKNIELFTDVDKLVQAYKKIINLIIKCSGGLNPEVKLSFYQTNKSVCLSIHHLNSVYKKTITDTLERGIGQTYGSLIKFQIHGLSDLYLRADFGGSFAEINIWNGKAREAKQLQDFKGVEHILKFPKNKF